MALSPRQILEFRLYDLKKTRQQWEPQWREIAENIAPYRYLEDSKSRQELDKGDRKSSDIIINSTPVESLNILAAGMMAGITSPARPWFSMTVSDKTLKKVPTVRDYLDQVKMTIADYLHASNWYDVLSNDIYPDLGSIATSAIFCEEDLHRGFHFSPMRCGEYWLDANEKGTIDTCFRRRWYTVRQLVQRFGLEACSPRVKMLWNRSGYGEKFAVIHAVFPNEEQLPGLMGPEGMAFNSLWWEETNPNRDQYLLRGGYHEFPVLTPRWSVASGDTYGRGPGWKVLGDCKALQHRELNAAVMVDKIVNPPLFGTGNVDKVNLRPGAFTHVPMGQNADVKPMHMVDPNAMREVREEKAELEQRIKQGLYVHLWQAAISDERNARPTATEVEARRDEVMLMLGPLLQNLDNGLLEPAIMRVFAILDRNNLLPIPPPELQGGEFSVEFLSIMHQAQQATGVSGLRALMEETGRTAQFDPGVIDKINTDAVVDQYANMFGVSPDVIRSDEEVEAIRKARAEAAQRQQMMQETEQGTQAMKNAGGAIGQESLRDIMSSIAPAAAAQAGARGAIGGGL